MFCSATYLGKLKQTLGRDGVYSKRKRTNVFSVPNDDMYPEFEMPQVGQAPPAIYAQGTCLSARDGEVLLGPVKLLWVTAPDEANLAARVPC